MSNFYLDGELAQRIDALSKDGLTLNRSQVIRYCLERQLPYLERKLQALQ